MAKVQSVWAIDIGQAALKALKLAPGDTPDQLSAQAFDYVEYPKILSQPDADPEELVRDAMRTFIERNDLKGSRVAIGVPGQTGLVKFIKLPPVEKKRIPDIVKFEAKQQIPFALEEVIWDWQEIGGGEDQDEDFAQTEIGLFAMKRDQIYRAIQPFQAAGIEVDFVQMSPIALYNFITFDQIKGAPGAEGDDGKAKEPGSIVLLDIGADNTDLIITDGVRIWQRNVPIGGNHFTRALTKELKLTFAKAEHLKKNATKAADPRQVFTAMRGVFSDFASEINRSIGFYSSVNRQAKISKVVGLGNGFKLPGLQKFLQQNVSFEVEKLENFVRLVGDEVTTAPQFQENVPSFAVAYGLGVQGLGEGGLKTNLLPGEINQVRMIRKKKPWALAASALLMLGASGFFFGNFRAWAKVNNERFNSAVTTATSVADQGNRYSSEYEKAKTDFNALKGQGEQLTSVATSTTNFPKLLKLLDEALYDPSVDSDPEIRKLSFDNPADRPQLDQLRIHVDRIRPVWKNDLNTEWFAAPGVLKDFAKNAMHPFDRETPPAGEGWVIEIVGHHYNPETKDMKNGAYFHLKNRVLPPLQSAEARANGFSHATVTWLVPDAKWTSDKALASNGMPVGAPALGHSAGQQAAAAGAEGGQMGGQRGGMMEAGGGPMGAQGGAMEGQMAGMQAAMAAQRRGAGGGMMGQFAGGMDMMYGSGGAAKKEDQMSYLQRTNFVLNVLWKPPAKDAAPVNLDEVRTKMADAAKKFANTPGVDLSKIREASIETSLQKAQEAIKAVGGAAAEGAAAPAGAAPAPAPAAAPGGASGAPAAAPAAPAPAASP